MKKIYLSFATILLLSSGFAQINSKPINQPLTPKVFNGNVTHPGTNQNNGNANNPGAAGNVLNPNNGHNCKSHELTQQHYQEQGLLNQFNTDYLNAAQNTSTQTEYQKTPGPNMISVIFHVIHEGEPLGTGTNVSNAAIMNVYQDIVEDFSLTNADQSSARTGFGFNPANAGINFCLATQDPMGNPLSETGVTRFQTTETWFDPDNPSEVNAMKAAPFGQPIWNRNLYLNVWICDISNGAGSGTAGYAYRPSTTLLPNSSIDGIVIDYNLGVNNDNILTHEIGHYLGLDHTWGGSGSCGSDDGFGDTPNTIGPSFNYPGSCSGNQTTCGATQTQYENYMDYSNCTVMFTTQQSNFMNTILSGIRSSLLSSPGCDPAGPPISNFTSVPNSPVIIPQNATVNFLDQSTASPTSWVWTISGVQGTDWNYIGGTNNTTQNPQVQFFNVGFYNVSLTASNGFGTGTPSVQNNYVQVVAPAAGTACDTLRNWDPADADANGYYYYNPNAGGWGFAPGSYDLNGTGLYGLQYAERLTYSGTAEVRRLQMPIFTAYDGSGTGTVDFKIYAGGGTLPGAVLATETVLISDLNAGAWNTIDFTTPATVTGTFYAGFELNYVPGSQDTVTFGMTSTIAGGVDDMYVQFSANPWATNYGFVGSIAMDVMLSNGPDPVAAFAYSEDEICVGGDVFVDASGSTNATSYEWYKTDDPYTTTIEFTTSSSNSFNFAGPAGAYAIYLGVDGSCKTDGLYILPVTVNAAVTAGTTVTPTTCGNNNGSVTFTGAAGGDGTYYYSLDNVNYQTSPTFNNLPSGTYTGYISTLGDNCTGTASFTINASSPLSGTATASVAVCNGSSTTLTATGGGTYQWFDGSTPLGTGATQVVSPTVQTQYSVQITNGGCTDVEYSLVNVTPLANASFAVTDFCNGAANAATGYTGGGTFTLTVNPNGATINGSTGEISGEAAGNTYTIQYAVGGTCPNTSTQNVTVSLNDNAAFTTANYCAGNAHTVNITGTTGGSFTYDGADASSINPSTGVITGGVAGTTYNITYTTPAGACQSVSSPIAVTVGLVPGVGAGADQAICSGNPVTLTATNPDGAVITWNNGVTNGNPFTPGVGTVTYTTTATLAGCTNTDAAVVTVSLTPTTNAGVDQSVCDGAMVTLSATNPNAAVISWDNSVTNGAAFTPPLGATTYTVTATLGSCSSTDQVIVTSNITPSVNAGLDTTVCEGALITLTATNPDAAVITWNNGVTDGVAFNAGAGSITYISTATLGTCFSTDNMVVNGNAAATVNGTVTHDDGTSNGAIDATISGGTGSLTYSWAPGGETTEDLTGLAAGVYTLTVTDSLGCEKITDFTVLSTVGIDASSLNQELLIFPNPTLGLVNITLTGDYNLTVKDARGRLVIQKSASDNSTIELSQFEAGVYFITIQRGDDNVVRKIILE